MKLKHQMRYQRLLDLRKRTGLVRSNPRESPEEDITERAAMTELPDHVSEELVRADRAVAETELEMQEVNKDIYDLKRRLHEVTQAHDNRCRM